MPKIYPITVFEDTRVFVLTGAGMSAESGLSTFQGAGGLWLGENVAAVATREAFAQDPLRVWQFYSRIRQSVQSSKPHIGHTAIAQFQRRFASQLDVCTQNIDRLHEGAGTENVIHLHGDVLTTCCSSCDRDPFEDTRTILDAVPTCDQCGAFLRPNVCWFGESPFGLGSAYDCALEATHLVVIGSSGVVEPASRFVRAARHQGRLARAIYLGLERPENAEDFDQVILGRATDLVPLVFAL